MPAGVLSGANLQKIDADGDYRHRHLFSRRENMKEQSGAYRITDLDESRAASRAVIALGG